VSPFWLAAPLGALGAVQALFYTSAATASPGFLLAGAAGDFPSAPMIFRFACVYPFLGFDFGADALPHALHFGSTAYLTF